MTETHSQLWGLLPHAGPAAFVCVSRVLCTANAEGSCWSETGCVDVLFRQGGPFSPGAAIAQADGRAGASLNEN